MSNKLNIKFNPRVPTVFRLGTYEKYCQYIPSRYLLYIFTTISKHHDCTIPQ